MTLASSGCYGPQKEISEFLGFIHSLSYHLNHEKGMVANTTQLTVANWLDGNRSR